jgi:glycosyltransferase involved in cell wall biosynthesis
MTSISSRIAFVSPRFSAAGTVGGAETLLKKLAEALVGAGRAVEMLTTCADNHFTWENARTPGVEQHGGLTVRYFAVDEDRDIAQFLQVQNSISNGGYVSEEDEELWMRNNVNSSALYRFLEEHGGDYDRIVMGPYLFGLIFRASLIHPEKTLLVPCLHDEPFAYLKIMQRMFAGVRGFIFNSEPEAELARSIFSIDAQEQSVVGMGFERFDCDGSAFSARLKIDSPYLIYSGRREELKGTPLLCDYVDTFRRRTGTDLKLLFTGRGDINAPSGLQDHIIDLGFVSEEEKHAAMAGARAFVHPSLNESFGIVLLESWLARTPALVHARSKVLRWQCRQSGGGLWFSSYPEFEEELKLLLEDEPLRRRLGESGRDYVLREYSWESVGKRLLRALDGAEGGA